MIVDDCGCTPSQKRAFVVRWLGALGVYVAVTAAVAFGFVNKLIPGALTIPAALLPIVPAAFFPFIMLDRLRRMDELQRKIQFEAIAFAFTMAALLTLSFGFLQGFANFPDVNWVWVWPVMGLLWVIGVLLGRRRYA
jgi:hypothetical protein